MIDLVLLLNKSYSLVKVDVFNCMHNLQFTGTVLTKHIRLVVQLDSSKCKLIIWLRKNKKRHIVQYSEIILLQL